MSKFYTIDDVESMMWDAGLGGAGVWVCCSCGVEHSSSDPYEVDSSSDEDWIDYVNVNGETFVKTCNGCKTRLTRYVDFIWHNRDFIRDYLHIRVDAIHSWAENEKIKNELIKDRRT